MAQAAERHVYDAELYRLQGEVLLAQAGPRHQAEAEARLHQALDVARRQAAKIKQPQQGLLPLVAYMLGLGQEEQIPLQD